VLRLGGTLTGAEKYSCDGAFDRTRERFGGRADVRLKGTGGRSAKERERTARCWRVKVASRNSSKSGGDKNAALNFSYVLMTRASVSLEVR
jgi:hypothetical protein